MASDSKYDVFLSYARGDDEPFVRRPCEDLTAASFEVWFDEMSAASAAIPSWLP